MTNRKSMGEELISSRSDSLTRSSSMENVLLLSNSAPTTIERLKIRCKPTYHRRKLKNKGAIVVLIQNYLAFTLFHYLYFTSINLVDNQKPYYMYITWGVTLPLVGWLADVCLGRHNVIRWSVWMMWVGFVSATASSVVANFVHVDERVTLVLLVLASAGFGGHQANVIQFGLDQLQDSSTDEIKSFISWYVWTTISAGLVYFTYICTQEEYRIFSKVLVCLCLSIALILTFYSERILIKEPVTQNPFKLIYNVIKYAIKNKHPRCRSAFTYCEDDLPSRIDFGKSKYGGPFTTEQVEDVKTFFRLLPVVFLYCTLASIMIIVNQLANEIEKLTYIRVPDKSTLECHLNKFYNISSFYITIILLPLYEFAIYPVLRKHFSWVKSYVKVLLGVLLLIGRVVALMVIVLEARHSYLEIHGYNSTVQCTFLVDKTGALSTTLESKWMVIPSVLQCLSMLTVGIGWAEFICAQLPYSMRGLMFGTLYGSVSLYVLIGYGITQPFTRETMLWGTGVISCEFWCLLLNLILLGVNCVMLSLFGKLYKRRKREDVLPNEQIFAERYYSQ